MESITMLAIAAVLIYFWRKDKSASTPATGSTTTTTNTVTNTPAPNPYARSDGAVSASRDNTPSAGSTGSIATRQGTSGVQDADMHGISQNYVNPNAASIVTQPATGPTTGTTPAGLPYVAQPITVPIGQSPYYWDEATWQRLFKANAFTNPDVAIAIYSKRNPAHPEYQ